MRDRLNALLDDVSAHPEHYLDKLAAASESTSKPISKPPKIFLGHGRNKLWARVHMYLKDELHLNVEAWESNPRTGLHSVDVLKTILDSCTFAVIVATGEDSTADVGVRARQNVVHEIGLFQGRLGFEKVALLQLRGVEEFSNLAGLQVIPFHDDQIEAAFYELGGH
ncbi:MAG: nucleotide-binding protein [Candidatus Acidiferrum sp.]|jgi:predicted nucleotide-binding protein